MAISGGNLQSIKSELRLEKTTDKTNRNKTGDGRVLQSSEIYLSYSTNKLLSHTKLILKRLE